MKMLGNRGSSTSQSESPEHGKSGAPSYRLLLTPAFISEIQERIDAAQSRILVQLMTFDGDDSGQDIAERLLAAVERGVKVRLLVDCFALRFVSDKNVKRPSVRNEAQASLQMYERLRAGGVDLAFTQPNGPGNLFALARNHKKVFVIDDDVYLGGINVSDHNFEWHDFMVHVQDSAVLDAVVDDVEFTFAGGRRSVNGAIITNGQVEQVFNSLILGARRSVELASPYAIDVGLTQVFDKVTARHKRVIATRRSNYLIYRVMSPYLHWRLRRSGTELASYTNFSHSKFLLVDDEKLLIGSSNYGRHSFWCNQEICILITDPGFIAEFKEQMLRDFEPMNDARPLPHIAFGGLVSWIMYGCVAGLRFTVAPRVPNLSRR